MADRDRWRENRNRQGEEDNDPIASVIGGLALLGGALYAASRMFSGGEQEEQRSLTRATSSTGQCQQTFTSSSESSLFQGTQDNSRSANGPTITIAVDATPTRVGGVLVIPAQEKVYFYSIDWTKYFTFGDEPDKFEMVNALLGLSIFEKYVASYRGSRDEVVVLKTDSTFCKHPDTVYRGPKNIGWRELFRKVDSKLKATPFVGEWQYKLKNMDDHLRIADKLSRTDLSTFPCPPVAFLELADDKLLGYTMCNVSSWT